MKRSSSTNGAAATAIDLAVLDTGPLYAAVDASDVNHERALGVLRDRSVRLLIPALVVAEAVYLIGSRLGASVEAGFLRGLRAFDVVAPGGDDWSRMAELVDQYAHLPLGGTDASLVALAERKETDLIVSFDRRHLGVVRSRSGQAFRLVP